jgi:hypothetical protein
MMNFPVFLTFWAAAAALIFMLMQAMPAIVRAGSNVYMALIAAGWL